MSRATSSATERALVMSQAGLSWPCSAWPTRSVATISGSQVSSAMTADLRGAGEDVDADLAEQHPLGLGDELVAGADDDVGLA